MKWPGHKVLPRSAIQSFCPTAIQSSFTFWSLSQQQLHIFSFNIIESYKYSDRILVSVRFFLLSSYWSDAYVEFIFHIRLFYFKKWSSSFLVLVWYFWQELYLLNLRKCAIFRDLSLILQSNNVNFKMVACGCSSGVTTHLVYPPLLITITIIISSLSWHVHRFRERMSN